MKLNLQDPKIKAVVVMQNGEILTETECSGELFPQYSITKSLVSLAVGMLLEEGRLTLETTVGALLDTPAEAPLSAVTLSELLTMRSGLKSKLLFADRRTCPDYLAACLAQEVGEKTAHYNNADAYLAGRMAETALGEPLEDLIVSRIFTPLGITRYDFEHDPQGQFFGASGLMLSTRDLAKLGEAVRTGELFPQSYLIQATRTQTHIDGEGYGYFFWTEPEGFHMSGKWGQKCFVLPKERAVVCINADDPGNCAVMPFFRNTLLPELYGEQNAV